MFLERCFLLDFNTKILQLPISRIFNAGSTGDVDLKVLPQLAHRRIQSKGQTYFLLFYLDKNYRVLPSFQLMGDGTYRIMPALLDYFNNNGRVPIKSKEPFDSKTYVRFCDVHNVLIYEAWNDFKSFKLRQYSVVNSELKKGGGQFFANIVYELTQSMFVDSEILKNKDIIVDFCQNYLKNVHFREKK